MNNNYKKIGDYISLIDTRNNDNNFSNLIGISINKCYIPSVANIVGTDLSNYKVIRNGQFACSLMQVSRDQRIPIAMYKQAEPSILSPAYVMFEVNRPNEVLPEYMDLWFKRAEFDREASFYAVGGVRGSLDWEDFCNLKLPIPSLSKQKEFVDNYHLISSRIDLLNNINFKLEDIAQTLFNDIFFKDDYCNCTLAEISKINPSRMLKKGQLAKCFDMSTLPTAGCIPDGYEIKQYNGGVRFKNGDTIIARITPCLENGKAAYINILDDDEIAFGSTEFIVFSSIDKIPTSFYYFLIRNYKFKLFALQFMNGSSGRQRVSGDELGSFPLKRPDEKDLNKFDNLASKVLKHVKINTLEIRRLKDLQNLILTNLA